MSKKEESNPIADLFAAKPSSPANNSSAKAALGLHRSPRKMNIDPNELIQNPMNKFVIRKDEDYEELRKSVEKDGILHPLICVLNEDNQKVLVSGHRRQKVALELGLKTVPIEIRYDDINNEEEMISFIARANLGSRKQTVFEMAAQIKLYINTLKNNPDNANISNADIHEKIIEAFTISESSSYNYEKLATLPDELLSWGSYGYLTRDQGMDLAKIIQDEKNKALIDSLLVKFSETLDNDEISNEEKSAFVKKSISQLHATVKKRVETKKSVNSFSLMKKLNKIVATENYSIPKRKEQRAQMLEMIKDAKEFLDTLEEKLNN